MTIFFCTYSFFRYSLNHFTKLFDKYTPEEKNGGTMKFLIISMLTLLFSATSFAQLSGDNVSGEKDLPASIDGLTAIKKAAMVALSGSDIILIIRVQCTSSSYFL